MAVYDKDKSFSFGWLIGGAFIMALTSQFGAFIAQAAGITTLEVLIAIVVVSFALGGFVVGWKSEGRTIIEAGLGAALVVVGTTTAHQLWGALDGQTAAILFGIPFGSAIVGAFIGEKVQGDTIETPD